MDIDNLPTCACGRTQGFPHVQACPRPYYGNDAHELTLWRRDFQDKMLRLHKDLVRDDAQLLQPERML